MYLAVYDMPVSLIYSLTGVRGNIGNCVLGYMYSKQLSVYLQN